MWRKWSMGARRKYSLFIVCFFFWKLSSSYSIIYLNYLTTPLGMWSLISPNGIKPVPLRWQHSLNHWPTRDVPKILLSRLIIEWKSCRMNVSASFWRAILSLSFSKILSKTCLWHRWHAYICSGWYKAGGHSWYSESIIECNIYIYIYIYIFTNSVDGSYLIKTNFVKINVNSSWWWFSH